MNTEIQITSLPESVSTATSLTIPEATTVEQWAQIGCELYHAGQRMTWWLADWAAFGERKHGELKEFCDLNGINYGTVKNLSSVAAAVEKSRRRDLLSFSHHFEVAALNPKDQSKWLIRAEKEKWSVVELRRQIRADLSEHGREVTNGPAPAIFGVEKFFLDGEVFLERNASVITESKEYLWPKISPMLKLAAHIWPDKVALK